MDNQIRIIWDESDVHHNYADIAQVKAGRDEFMLLFGKSPGDQGKQGQIRVKIDERILLNPTAAKRLAWQLNRIIQEYESRFGFLDGQTLIQDRLRPTSPLIPPHFRSARGATNVALLFQFLDEQGVQPAFERSCEFLANTMLGNRFLLGFEKRLVRGDTEEKLLDICEQMDMPVDFRESFQKNLLEANIVGFGFGEQQGICIIKAYLEFGNRFYRAIKSQPQQPEPYLSHLGFKWDAEDNTRKALARYTCFPGYTAREIEKRLSEDFYGSQGGTPYESIKGILELASNRASQDRFLYLEVKEENNPRSSFDINVYSANLELQEIRPFLQDMCQHYMIPEEQFLDFYNPVQTQILGHLAGGLDREGRDFFTIYYGE